MVDVRRVSPDNWELWRDVRLAALTDAPEAFGEVLADWIDADEAKWRQRMEGLAFLAVAFVDDAPVGKVAAYAPDDLGLAKLIALWVAPSARGRDVGAPLMHAVSEWARTSDAAAVVLSVWDTNDAAIRLYERLGFAPSPEPSLMVIAGATWYRLPLR